jgi:hypothetical protein
MRPRTSNIRTCWRATGGRSRTRMPPGARTPDCLLLFTFQTWHYVNRDTPAELSARLAEAPFFGRSRTIDRFSLAYVPYALAVWPFRAKT